MAAAPSPSPTVPPLLTTKLYAPRWRPGQVSRRRLVQRIARGTQSRLTLVSAPPGFGKSTLVAEWLASAPETRESVGWVSLDAGDNDLATFWAYLVRALQSARPGVGQAALAMLDAPSPPPVEVLLAVLLNDIAASAGEIVVVLDDYHVIENAAIHDGMAFLIENMPPRMHVVIASRADPPLPLARLRARGELVEVRARDLRFTPEEAAAFLNGEMGLALPDDSVAALEARTEGWIAALQLAALSMQGRDDVRDFIGAFAGDDRYIVDYLVEEVLQRQPSAVREFLLQTAILDRLNASLCDAVTGRDGGRAMLEALDRANLFIVPLDDKRQWFRYHHLFADVLRAHLHEENPAELPILHTRASAWFTAENLRVPAIRHALAANDFERAALLVELESQSYALNHQPARLLEWLALLPDNVIRTMPVLCTNAAIALQGMGDLEGSRARLDDAERLLAGPESALVVADPAALDSVPTRIANGRGFLAIAAGDIEATVRHAHDALALALEDDFHWRGTAASLMAMAHWKRGDLDAAQPYHAQGLASLERAGDFGLAVMSAFHDADLLKARGRLFEARAMLERSLELSARFSDSARLSIANLHLGLCELCCDQGDLAGAALQLRLAEEKGIYEPRTPYRTPSRARGSSSAAGTSRAPSRCSIRRNGCGFAARCPTCGPWTHGRRGSGSPAACPKKHWPGPKLRASQRPTNSPMGGNTTTSRSPARSSPGTGPAPTPRASARPWTCSRGFGRPRKPGAAAAPCSKRTSSRPSPTTPSATTRPPSRTLNARSSWPGRKGTSPSFATKARPCATSFAAPSPPALVVPTPAGCSPPSTPRRHRPPRRPARRASWSRSPRASSKSSGSSPPACRTRTSPTTSSSASRP